MLKNKTIPSLLGLETTGRQFQTNNFKEWSGGGGWHCQIFVRHRDWILIIYTKNVQGVNKPGFWSLFVILFPKPIHQRYKDISVDKPFRKCMYDQWDSINMCKEFHDEIIGNFLDKGMHTINEKQNLKKWRSSAFTTARWD